MGDLVVEARSDELRVRWPDGVEGRFHALWLRDNCPSAGDRDNAFRTFSVAQLDPDLSLASARVIDGLVVLEYSNGDCSEFDVGWLRENRARQPAEDAAPLVELWRGQTELVEFSADQVAARSLGHLQLLETIARRGASVVTGTDTSDDGTARLASLFGRLRETDFGSLFDIVLEPDAWTKSQTGHALDPHTDDPYRYTPSGASVLHCVESSTTGGKSTLVDGFAVADELRRSTPEFFEVLCTNPAPFIRHRRESADQGEDVHLVAHAPIIAVDHRGNVCGVRFHERSMGVLDIDPDVMGLYYQAFIAFTSMINDADFAVQRMLSPGEALMFDNQRVLHGRTAFDDGGGRRHLRLCTVDRDQFHSRLRRLREDHGLLDAGAWLPAGNLS